MIYYAIAKHFGIEPNAIKYCLNIKILNERSYIPYGSK